MPPATFGLLAAFLFVQTSAGFKRVFPGTPKPARSGLNRQTKTAEKATLLSLHLLRRRKARPLSIFFTAVSIFLSLVRFKQKCR
jgi:hypothetical protein